MGPAFCVSLLYESSGGYQVYGLPTALHMNLRVSIFLGISGYVLTH